MVSHGILLMKEEPYLTRNENIMKNSSMLQVCFFFFALSNTKKMK
jgi:hypothetical protein